jgi:TRAP-type mannitol/chloroaromatic compound transport system permease small subunit
MLGAGYALLHEGHVRIDVFYASAGPRYRAWVDLLGGLFLLLPFTLITLVTSLPYVHTSWLQHEQSREAGGLPDLWLLKGLIPLFALLLLLQGLSMMGKSLLVLAVHRHDR